MSFTYGFYNSIDEDRVYDAIQFGSIFDGIISDGVFRTIGDKFSVTANGTNSTVLIGTGRFWFQHTWGLNDTPYSLTLPTVDASKARIDAIVIEVDHNDLVRATSLKVVKGTAASSPQKPSLTKAGKIYQYAIAYVTRRPLAIENPSIVKTADVEYVVGKSETPWVSSVVSVYS